MDVQKTKEVDSQKLYAAISQLYDKSTRFEALKYLSDKNTVLDPVVLWNAFGVVTVLLEEIVSIYPYLSPCTITQTQCDTVCYVIAILQNIGTSPQTYLNIIKSDILVYLHPLLKAEGSSRCLAILRITAFGLFGAISKLDSPEIIPYFIRTNLLMICIENIKEGPFIEKTITSFILQRITQNDQGFEYICQTAQLCQTLCSALSNCINPLNQSNKYNSRFYKHVIRCFHLFIKNPNTREIIAQTYPSVFDQEQVQSTLEGNTKQYHQEIKQFINSK